MLPGIRLEKVANTTGMLTSIAFSPTDQLYYSVLAGTAYRVDGSVSTPVHIFPSDSEGNAGLLGIVFRDDHTLIAHYSNAMRTAEIIESVDLATGVSTVLAQFPCPLDRPCSTEHHGGNPALGSDGSIYVGIGDMAIQSYVQDPKSLVGKIFHVSAEGEFETFATGVRNPFDIGYSAKSGKLIVGDNGAVGDDEITQVSRGDNLGWPFYTGWQQAPGFTTPSYVFSQTTAPTGLAITHPVGPIRAEGLLLTSFVKKALYLFPDANASPLPDPIEMIGGEPGGLIDVTQNSNGEIYIATLAAIYRVILPAPGDANGDGKIDASDADAIARELLDDGPHDTLHVQGGSFAASWGADVNGDGVVDARDLIAFSALRRGRVHSVRQ
jgi:hypothetical protein